MKTYHIFTFDLWRCTPVRRLSRRGRVGIPIPCARPTKAAQQQATKKVRHMFQEEHPHPLIMFAAAPVKARRLSPSQAEFLGLPA